jgi:hypothetical protein
MGVMIEVDAAEYIGLLVKSGVTDPARWPEQVREGAALLARIREIEAQGRAEHGVWDWELLSEELQDEYDSLCGELDQLRYQLDPQPGRPGADVFADIRQRKGL